MRIWLIILVLTITLTAPASDGADQDHGKSLDWTAMQHRVQQINAAHSNACVSIRSQHGAWGSGVLVSANGHLFSAAHSFERVGEPVAIFFETGDREEAIVVRIDRDSDIAVLQVSTIPHLISYVKLAETSAPDQVVPLIALGHPSGFDPARKAPLRFGFGYCQEHRGIISSTCSVTAGDSGGPLFNLDGNLLGIHRTMDANGGLSIHTSISQFFATWPDLKEAIIPS